MVQNLPLASRSWLQPVLFLALALNLLVVVVDRVRGRIPFVPHATAPVPRASSFGLSESSDARRADDKFKNAVFLIRSDGRAWTGTFAGGDGFVGRVVSTWFPLDDEMIRVPIVGYPSTPGNSLMLEISQGGQQHVIIPFTGANPRETPGSWDVRVSAWKGKSARLVLVDSLTNAGGWLGVAAPEPFHARHGPDWLQGIPRNYGWLLVVALAVATLLLVPGLALREWLPHRFPRPVAFIPLPGIGAGALNGLLVWILGPSHMLPFWGLWVGGSACGALALALRSRRRPIIFEPDEACVLPLYLSVATGALAFGVLPLDVAAEFGRRDSSQARMIASPPDHYIPFATAAYLYHGKNGKTDSNAYFGDTWSIASRGPLAPLMIAAMFVVFDAEPRDPPQLTLEAWPVTGDGFILARCVGIFTNALVVLSGALLASRLAAGAGRIAALWLSVAPVVVINTDFLWPKLFACYFLLLAIAEEIAGRRALRVGWLAALGYLSHPVAGLFLPPLACFAAWRAWSGSTGAAQTRARAALSRAASLTSWVVVALLPWLAYKAWLGRHDTFLDYPFGDGRGFAHAASLRSWCTARWDNLRLSLVPGAFYLSGHMRTWFNDSFGPPLRWAISYAKALPGEVGLPAFVVLALGILKKNTALPRGFRRCLLFGALGLMLLFWGFSSDGLGRNCLEPLALVAIAYAAAAFRPDWPGWPWLIGVTLLEGISVRALGVVFAPSFSLTSINAEILVLAGLALGLSVGTVAWALIRTHAAARVDRQPDSLPKEPLLERR